MKWLLIIALVVNLGVFGQVTLTESHLPIIILNTGGAPIEDDPRIQCEMGIIDNGSGVMNNVNDPFNDYHGYITIEIRGSTSQQYPKKNYGFSTVSPDGVDINVSLLDLPPENDWILYGPYPDKTLIRNVMTFDLFRRMGHYASRTRYCELIINGEYRGLYVLMEKLKRDDARIQVTPLDSSSTAGDPLTGGYVFKVDKLTGTTVETFVSAYNSEVLFQYHDPGPDELHPLQKSYLQDYVSNFEDMLWGPNFNDPNLGYHQYIDKISFYDFFLLQEVGRTVDGYRSSCFLYKDKNSVWDGLLHAGPVWDFNLSYGNADYCNADQTTGWQYQFDNVCPWFTSSVPFWWGKLLTDTSYCNGLQCRWQELRQGPLRIDSLHDYIDSVALYLEDARIRNFQKWPIIGVYVNWNGYVGQTYQEDVDYLKWYIQTRIEWMDNNLPGTCWPGLAGQEQMQPDPVLSKAWPNPFDEEVHIGFTLPDGGETEIWIYELSGKIIYQKHLGKLAEGNYIKTLQLTGLSAGSYIYTVITDGVAVSQNKLTKK
ncbi:MAG: CotH kinase family protein [Crocinitomicaceae bacterium]|nr:CotH kinase family protein [Crocinitomicaceae bacterium]